MNIIMVLEDLHETVALAIRHGLDRSGIAIYLGYEEIAALRMEQATRLVLAPDGSLSIYGFLIVPVAMNSYYRVV